MNWEIIKRTPLVSAILRWLNPSHGVCPICGLPWNHAGKTHDIMYDEELGFFPCCEHCYQHSDADRILEAELDLWATWKRESERTGSRMHTEYSEYLEVCENDLVHNGKI